MWTRAEDVSISLSGTLARGTGATYHVFPIYPQLLEQSMACHLLGGQGRHRCEQRRLHDCGTCEIQSVSKRDRGRERERYGCVTRQEYNKDDDYCYKTERHTHNSPAAAKRRSESLCIICAHKSPTLGLGGGQAGGGRARDFHRTKRQKRPQMASAYDHSTRELAAI